ncbi:MAG: hypothetical protein FWD05_05715 [Oscillospiraceae bacterium]|nr:hypothetical protein [Oscillospiraceae bacterium]
MDFITYNLNWYKERLDFYSSVQKNRNVTKDIVHEAKILHKFLEDIRDEGYLSTYGLFQNQLQATQTLTDFIELNHETPFRLDKVAPVYKELVYKQSEKPLLQYIDSMSQIAKQATTPASSIDGTIYEEILDFCKWVHNSIPKNTTVIFLLRDTLLPYLAFRQWNDDCSKIALPMLIGRKFLSQFGDGETLYNGISDALYTVLHDTKEIPSRFQESSVEHIKDFLLNNNSLRTELEKILSEIKTPNISIVETGAHGTMPLLLKACDRRINHIMLYTTLPWLYNSWGQYYYTKKYENLRLFETLSCQDKLLSFSQLKDGVFYIREIDDDKIIMDSRAELSCWNQIVNRADGE